MSYSLLTVDDVKAITKGGGFDPDHEVLLEKIIIPGIGKLLAEECCQTDFDKLERTYYLSPHERQRTLFLDFPIDQSVSADPVRGPVRVWTSTALPRAYTEELVNGTDFFVNDADGTIERVSGTWPQGVNTVKVLATTKWVTANAKDVPSDLYLAATLATKSLFDNRENFGLSSVSMEGGSRSIAWPLLSKDIKNLLKPYYKEPHVWMR